MADGGGAEHRNNLTPKVLSRSEYYEHANERTFASGSAHQAGSCGRARVLRVGRSRKELVMARTGLMDENGRDGRLCESGDGVEVTHRAMAGYLWLMFDGPCTSSAFIHFRELVSPCDPRWPASVISVNA